MLLLKNVAKDSGVGNPELVLSGSLKSLAMVWSNRTRAYGTDSSVGVIPTVSSDISWDSIKKFEMPSFDVMYDSYVEPEEVTRCGRPRYAVEILMNEILGNSIDEDLTEFAHLRLKHVLWDDVYERKFLFAPVALYQLYPVNPAHELIPRKFDSELISVGYVTSYQVHRSFEKEHFSKAFLNFEFQDSRGNEAFDELVDESLLKEGKVSI